MKITEVTGDRLVIQKLRELSRRLQETRNPLEAADLIALIAELSEKLNLPKAAR